MNIKTLQTNTYNGNLYKIGLEDVEVELEITRDIEGNILDSDFLNTYPPNFYGYTDDEITAYEIIKDFTILYDYNEEQKVFEMDVGEKTEFEDHELVNDLILYNKPEILTVEKNGTTVNDPITVTCEQIDVIGDE